MDLPFINVESSICGQLGFTPTLSADGTATIQLQFPTFAPPVHGQRDLDG